MAGSLFLGRKSRAEDEKEGRDRIYMIKTCEISPNPAQPRKYFTDEAIYRLAESIKKHGLIQPLTVRPTENGYELIAGERRLRALKLIGATEVPCVINNVGDEESAHLAIIENIQRENLNMFEQAMAILNLMKVHCITQEKIAHQLSCSQSYVANKLRLLKISEEERELILENSLTERHARALLRIKDENGRKKALRLIIKKELNVAATEDMIDSLLENQRDKTETRNTKILVKDVRLFYNTIDKAIETMRASGMKVETQRRETCSNTEIVIMIPKCST